MVLLFLLVSTVEVSVLVKKKLIRDVFVFLILMAVALTYAISGVTKWDFPAPSALAEMIFMPLSRLFFPSLS